MMKQGDPDNNINSQQSQENNGVEEQKKATMDFDWGEEMEKIGVETKQLDERESDEKQKLQKAQEALGLAPTGDSVELAAIKQRKEQIAGPTSPFEAKINEYVARIQGGEDKERTLNGLPPRMRADIEAKLGGSTSVETTVPAPISAPVFENNKDAQSAAPVVEPVPALVESSEGPVEKMVTALGQYYERAKRFDEYVKQNRPSQDDPQFASLKDSLIAEGVSLYENSDWSIFGNDPKNPNTLKLLAINLGKLRTITEGISDGSYVLGGRRMQLVTPKDFADTVMNIGTAFYAMQSVLKHTIKQK